ncbi:MAG: peptidoglycan DD-metalloendopeptidase family protein [Pseudonocardiaceae bacterium]|nr:peptidoglycan DD-metalloendopeptidase family protein [Pseudonocardiaceae bacterium]
MARHRSPGRSRASTTLTRAARGSHVTAAHRLPRPSPALRGRVVIAAVTVGAFSIAAQHTGDAGIGPAHADDVGELAIGGDAAVAMMGMGGNRPAPGVLPLPEVLPAAPTTPSDELSALDKGSQVAAEREAAEREAAERERAEAEREAAGIAVAPVAGTITSLFGPRWGSTHSGLDIANSIGVPIVSAMGGEVIDSGPASGFGLWVRVQHDDGTIAVYGHINENLVEVGERVGAGDQIATVGNRGDSTGPHLHFEVLQDGEEVDPVQWLRDNGADI